MANVVRAVCLTIVFLLTGCSLGGDSAPDRGGRPNIVLVTFDTLRADFLGAYGDQMTRTPTFDRLAQRSVTFERAYATSPFTPTSLWSLLHSVWIHDHMYETNLRERYKGATTFVQRLDESGYETAGFTGSSILNRGSGFAKGFAWYEDTWSAPYLHNETTLTRVSEYLGARAPETDATSPFFLYVHFYDPHGLWGDAPARFTDYAPEPSHFAGLQARFFEGRNALKRSSNRMIRSILEYLDVSSAESYSPSHLARLLVPSYRSEISWSDDILDRLLERLDDAGALDDSLLIVSSDHGYTFADHYQVSGYVFPLFDETVRVPLFIRLPSRRPGRVDAPVSLIDVGATILDYAGVADRHGSGRSLRGVIQGDEAPDGLRVIYAEGVAVRESQLNLFRGDDRGRYAAGVANRHTMLVDPPYKLVHMPHRRGEAFELFDLEADPGEERNIFSADDAEHRRLAEQLLHHERKLERLERGETSIDEQAMERLRALGYIEDEDDVGDESAK